MKLFLPFLFSSLMACGGAPPPVEAMSPVPAPTPETIPSTLSDARDAIRQGKLEIGESALRKLAESEDQTTRKRALAILALFYQEQNRIEESAEAYRNAIESYPEVAPILGLRLTEVLRENGQIEAAIATARAIIGKYPATAAAGSAALRLPVLHTLAEDEANATASFARTAEIAIDSLNDEEFVALADQLAQNGRQDLATALRMRIISDFPQSRFTEKLYGQLTSLPGESSPIVRLGFAESVALADRLGRVNRYDQALDLIRRIEKRFPARVSDPSLRFTRVTSHFNSRRYPEVVAESPAASEPYYREIQLRRAHAFWRMDRPSEFVTLARQIVSRHPGTREATTAKLLLSKYHTTDDVNFDRAVSLLSEVIAEGSLGNDGDNIWTLGWMYTQAGRDDEALATFERYLARFPDADYTSNSLFWTAKIHERNGRIAERDAVFTRLIDFYPYTYYSYRARQILGDTSLPTSISNPRYVFPAVDAAPPDPRLATVRELTEIGLTTEAAREMQRLTTQSTADPLLAWRMADLYAEIGEPLRANQILQRSFRDIIRHGGTNVPARFWQILYPRPFWDDIQASARHSAIEPNLITAITRQESAFNPNVVSNAGAVGLMQIMPEEASRIAQGGGLPPVTRQDLFNPRTNIMVGGAEIRQKLDSMKGHPVLAIASYNAGEVPV
ncbi:MAG TPA: transglycosylase SLT domain-containing protein, partial [Thermoanaerobaculia bacterium]|nr:transglycosylase SLT domain-containing protein [Thermoanaerobaculia bacterium]